VLRRRPALDALLSAIAGCERLVLLGDTLELRHGPLRETLAATEAVLRDVASALGSGREVVIVPGNHDHRLLRGWLELRDTRNAPEPLGLESRVEWHDGEPLATIASWLDPAPVRAAYPGVWLRDDVYATHGHYGDRHVTVPIVERLGAGLMARFTSESDGSPRRAEDYEATLGPMYAWIDAVAQSGRLRASDGSLQVRAWRALQRTGPRTLRQRGAKVAFGAAVLALNRAGLGPLGTDVSGAELRRASLRAFGESLARLGVDAQHVIFGHTHRAGPLQGDERSEWSAGPAALLNTGSWVYERRFLGDAPDRSPYRPGFAALVGDEGAPELLNLLDGTRQEWPAAWPVQG
jgi:hypothetical protein